MAKEVMNSPQLPLAQTTFPGRSVLTISEVAKTLNCTETHVRDLIDEGQLVAVDIAGPPVPGGRPPRQCLRIPVSSYDNFLRARAV
jgi:excisionase family DNA binding protein